METLSKQATLTFNKLVELTKANNGYVKVDNTGNSFMPVSVEILSDIGNRVNVSIAHYYEQNGDLMADPEMCFYIVNGSVFPYYFKQDNVGMEEDSIIFEDGEIKGYKEKMQRDHATFANMWLNNIKEQQEL